MSVPGLLYRTEISLPKKVTIYDIQSVSRENFSGKRVFEVYKNGNLVERYLAMTVAR